MKERQIWQDLHVREDHVCQDLEGPVNKWLLRNVILYIVKREILQMIFRALCSAFIVIQSVRFKASSSLDITDLRDFETNKSKASMRQLDV